MTKEELIKGLTECGVKKKEIEEKLGMPKNSLSGMISGSKPIPEKWFVLLEGFLIGHLPETVSEVLPKEEEPVTFGIIPRTEEAVLIPEEMPNSHIKVPEKVVLPKAKGIMMGADYLADVPKTTFQKLLIEFNLLIDDQPPIKQVEGKLYELIEKSQHHDLNARQSEAIRERCINYLTGQYGKKKQS